MAMWASVVEAPSIIVLTNQGTPSDIKMAKEFAPSELEIPKPPSPVNRDKSVSGIVDAPVTLTKCLHRHSPRRIKITHEIASGRQPPPASRVIPMTLSGMPIVCPIKATIQ